MHQEERVIKEEETNGDVQDDKEKTAAANESGNCLDETCPFNAGAAITQPNAKLKTFYTFRDMEYQELYKDDLVKESAIAWKECTKYPGHEGFIPLPEFTLQYLPQRLQREYVLDHIKAWADLTVRLRIKMSPNRPKDDQSDKSQGFTGTAFISCVTPREEDCPCKACNISGDKGRKWWDITLTSAAHCVYDDYEASNVKIDFFYDSKECQSSGKVKTLQGANLHGNIEPWDDCRLQLVTHDEELGRKLEQRNAQFLSILSKLTQRYGNTNPRSAPQNKVMVCVSHPHGESKQVTVGELRDKYDVTHDDLRAVSALTTKMASLGCILKQEFVEYTTRTCSGSSGSRVICLDDLVFGDVMTQLNTYYTHSRANLRSGCNVGSRRSTEFKRRNPILKILGGMKASQLGENT